MNKKTKAKPDPFDDEDDDLLPKEVLLPKKPQQPSPPVVIKLNSISEAKMDAITTLCRAVHELALALNRSHTSFTLENISVSNAQTGIHIDGTGI